MTVSVCMATYNGANYIKEQLESILIQLSPNDEVIISDDGSTDNTISIIKAINDSRVLLISNNTSHGVVANFNNALSYAKGDYVFLSDQDDIWLEGRVSRTLAFLDEYDLVVSNCSVIDHNKEIIIGSYFNKTNSKKGFLKNIVSSSYLGCSLAFNRAVYDCFMPIPLNLMMYHDWWIGFIADIKFNVFFDPKPTFLYRRHQNAVSSTVNPNGSQRTMYIKIASRVQLVCKALGRFIRTHHGF
ncbi:glycosyltransferase family 2 protein [Aeromonas caviae]